MTLDLDQEPAPSLPDLAPLAGPAGRRRHTPRAHVVAVVLARDGADRLPRVLAALAASTRRPDATVGVDLGSRDDTAALLAAADPAMPVLRLPRAATAGDAVDAVLALRAAGDLAHANPAGTSGGSPGAEPPVGAAVDWIWLLPHDAAPVPRALEQLLFEVETAPSVGVAGCKQVAWDDDQRLLDVGFTASSLGLRVTGLDRDEVDQGQHDGRRDVLAVSGAGMLVRRDLWEALGGLDPGLDGGPAWAAADLDLCRRAHLAGHRVVVVPSAVIARGTRRPPRRAARAAVLHLRLAATPLLLLPLAVAAVVLAAPLRVALLLAAGNASAAGEELSATWAALTRPPGWRRTRRRARIARQVPGTVLRRLRPPLGQLARQRYDAVHAWLAPAPEPASVATPTTGRLRRAAAALGPVVPAAVAGLALERDLVLGGADPVGPWLLPAPASAGELWQAATSAWRPVGLGAHAAADPFAALLAGLGLVSHGPPNAVRVLLVAAVPLAALAGWTAAATLTRSRALRWWAALAWAAAPPLLDAVTAGRPAAVLAHVLLPLAAAALVPAAGLAPARRPAAPACRLGLLLTALLAAAPSLAVPAGAVLVAAALAGRRPLRLGLAAAVPAVLLLPWWVAVAREPRLLLTDPAVADAARHDPAGLAAGLAQAAGWWPAAAAVTPLALAALVGPLRRRAGGAAVLGWWAAAAGAAGAAAAVAVPVARAGGAALTGVPGPCLSLALAGIGAAGLLGGRALAGRARSPRNPRVVRFALVLAAVTAMSAPAAALAAAPVLGPVPLTGRAAAPLPAVAAAEGRGPDATRTLLLAVGRGGIRWSLASGAGPVLGDSSAALAAAALQPTARRAPAAGPDDAVVLPVLAQLLSGSGRDPCPALAELAVGSVVLLPPADAATTLALDAEPGLTRLGDDRRSGLLWRVEPPAGSVPARPARALVQGADGSVERALPFASDAVHARLAGGSPGRRLVLAERYDGGWRATLDGAPLVAVHMNGWAQGFALPGHGGLLEVHRVPGALAPAAPARAVALGLALLVALPLPRRRGRWAPPPPPVLSRPVPRPAAAPDDPNPAAGRRGPRVYDDDEHPEDTARPLYVGPPPRRLRRRRLRLRRLLRRGRS